jgi:hypothetical protein
MKYQIKLTRKATYQEVFDNLKYGGLKLIYENLKTKTFSQVAWSGDNQIEIITIRNDKVYNDYFMTFSSPTLESMMDNKIFVNNYSRWYIGYIKD